MVDALRRAHRMITLNGYVVDVHPLETPAQVEVGDLTIGPIDAADAPLRHAAASRALAAVVHDALFDMVTALDFDFFTYGDTIEELQEYIVENWRNARIDDETMERARDAIHGAAAGVRPRVLERVRLTTLRPIARNLSYRRGEA